MKRFAALLIFATLLCAMLLHGTRTEANDDSATSEIKKPQTFIAQDALPLEIRDLSGEEYIFDRIGTAEHGLGSTEYFIYKPDSANESPAPYAMPSDKMTVYSGSYDPESGGCPRENPQYFTMPEFSRGRSFFFAEDDTKRASTLYFFVAEKRCIKEGGHEGNRVQTIIVTPQERGFSIQRTIHYGE